MLKKLSLITNFYHCTFNCPYCIWRQSGNFEKYKDFIWTEEFIDYTFESKLREHLKSIPSGHIYSISGGSDPLNCIDSNASIKFYNILHRINKDFGLKYQLHTARIDLLNHLPEAMYDNLDKIALHVLENEDIKNVLDIYNFITQKQIKLRIALVVTSFLKKSFCEKLEHLFKNSNMQISYRELWPVCVHDDLDWFKNASTRNPKNMFVQQADYNTYIMPDLSLTDKFIQE